MVWKQTQTWLKWTMPLGLAVVVAACGGNSDNNNSSASPTASAVTSASASPSASVDASPSASAAASPSAAALDGYKTYTNATSGVSMQYPQDWTMQENVAGALVAFLSPPEGDSDKFQENVNLVVQDLAGQEITLDQYTELSMKQLEQLITDYKLVSSDASEENGVKAQVVEYTGTQGQQKLKWKQKFFIADGKAYVVSYTAVADNFDKFKDTADQMMGTVKLG